MLTDKKKLAWIFKMITRESIQEYESFDMELSKNRLIWNKFSNEQLRVGRFKQGAHDPIVKNRHC